MAVRGAGDLGGLSPDCVQVQLYAEAAADEQAACLPMQCQGRMHGAVNGYIYRADIPADRPAETSRRGSSPITPMLSSPWKPRGLSGTAERGRRKDEG